MWKKSGAWFYKEMPTYVKPFDSVGRDSSLPLTNGTGFYGGGGDGDDAGSQQRPQSPRYSAGNNTAGRRSAEGNSGRRSASNQPHSNHHSSGMSPTHNAFGAMSIYDGPPASSSNNYRHPMPFQVGPNAQVTHNSFATMSSSNRQVPIPPDQQQRLKTAPRPRITPSWVHEKVQSSVSIGSEDEEEDEMGEIGSSSSSLDVSSEYRRKHQGGGVVSSGAVLGGTSISTAPRTTSGSGSGAPQQQRRPHHSHSRPKDFSQRHQHSTTSTRREPRESKGNLQRIVLSSRSRATDTEESDNDESRRTTPSTSPRHSIATPSSYGGDDTQNPAASDAIDSKSIDSGGEPIN